MILMGIGIGSAGVVAIAMGQQGVEPRDAGTAGAMNNVAQQVDPPSASPSSPPSPRPPPATT